jgi:hypothetical protein
MLVGTDPDSVLWKLPSRWAGSALMPYAGRITWTDLSLRQSSGDVWPGDGHRPSGVNGHKTCILSYLPLGMYTVMAVLFRHAEYIMRRRE